MPPEEYARCVKCERMLPASAFKPNGQMKSGIHSWCRACEVEYLRAWRASNRDRVDDYNVKRRKPPLRLVCPECGRDAVKKAHPHTRFCSEDCRAIAERRRRRTSITFDLRCRDWQGNGEVNSIALGRYNAALTHDPCSYCGGVSDVLDHIEPKARGGSNAWANLTAACATCNARKSSRTLLAHLLTSHHAQVRDEAVATIVLLGNVGRAHVAKAQRVRGTARRRAA